MPWPGQSSLDWPSVRGSRGRYLNSPSRPVRPVIPNNRPFFRFFLVAICWEPEDRPMVFEASVISIKGSQWFIWYPSGRDESLSSFQLPEMDFFGHLVADRRNAPPYWRRQVVTCSVEVRMWGAIKKINFLQAFAMMPRETRGTTLVAQTFTQAPTLHSQWKAMYVAQPRFSA